MVAPLIVSPSSLIVSSSSISGTLNGNSITLVSGTNPAGTILFNMLRTPSLIRREMKKSGILIQNDKPGAWSVISGVRDKILKDIGLTI